VPVKENEGFVTSLQSARSNGLNSYKQYDDYRF